MLRLWPAVGILAATGIFLLAETGTNRSGTPAAHWLSTTAPAWIRDYPPEQLAMVFAVGLFLVESANIVVRSALYPGTIHPRTMRADATVPLPDLRGGRLIGPRERLGLVSLTLAGMFTIVAALIAAKGIVRFPEISNDGATGSKAEYFLVGSLFSWGLAMLGVALVAMAGKSG